MAHTDGARHRGGTSGTGGTAGTVHVGDLRPGDHACALYASDEERASILRGFLLGGLDAKHKILYLADADGPRGPGELLEQCRFSGPPEVPAGQLEVLGPAELSLRQGELDPAALLGSLRAAVDRSRSEGYRALRITGDLCTALCDGRDVSRLLRYEALLAAEFGSGEALAVCQCDTRRCDPAALDAFASAHPRSVEVDPLIRTAELVVVRTFDPPGLRIEGVVDTASHRHLRDALQSVASVRGDVRLEMSRVEFLDLAGLRLLMTFARARAARHCTVELAGVPPHLLHVITLIGWDRTPGLRLGAAHAC
ncbi:MEDS domain-containing protein [Streptomyces olivoreticuli]|uniref:MEDS domain-containing protein n=1 Tax=Streptomyces olivoreticuli TaxID=68246 RepID=UPI00265AE9CA|nr:MEDS domain-containing protein [Streptomyces olivoreticuli]WKK25666.1 MEDS domain-containing protein [Streptomyces olivoreticuli]